MPPHTADHIEIQSNEYLIHLAKGSDDDATVGLWISDMRSGAAVLRCRELKAGWPTRWLRATRWRSRCPLGRVVETPEGVPVLFLRRSFALLRTPVEILDSQHRRLGYAARRVALTPSLEIQDAEGQAVCNLRGNWTSWEFRFLNGSVELARVTRAWRGSPAQSPSIPETSDDYVLKFSDALAADAPVRPLILGAVLCIDAVLDR